MLVEQEKLENRCSDGLIFKNCGDLGLKIFRWQVAPLYMQNERGMVL
jgi:hypothetical protein